MSNSKLLKEILTLQEITTKLGINLMSNKSLMLCNLTKKFIIPMKTQKIILEQNQKQKWQLKEVDKL